MHRQEGFRVGLKKTVVDTALGGPQVFIPFPVVTSMFTGEANAQLLSIKPSVRRIREEDEEEKEALSLVRDHLM